MLYLKNALGGLGRSFTDSAMHAFQGPYRWWKLAAYALVFALPGGSLGVLFFAWADQRRSRRQATRTAGQAEAGRLARTATCASLAGSSAAAPGAAIVPGASVCQARSKAPSCRAAVGKIGR